MMEYSFLPFYDEIRSVGLAWLLFLAYFLSSSLVFRKYGSRYSPIHRSLFDKGYDATFGFVVASVFLIFVGVSCFVLISMGFSAGSLREVLIGTFGSYALLTCLINLWGKRFLISQGIDPRPKDGYKGFWQDLKDSIAEKKEEQRRKQDDPLL